MLLFEFEIQQLRWRLGLSYWGWWWRVRWRREHCCFFGWPIDGGGPIGWFTQSRACYSWLHRGDLILPWRSRRQWSITSACRPDQTLARINPIHSYHTWHPGRASVVPYLTPFTDAVNVLPLHCSNMTQKHMYRIHYLMVDYLGQFFCMATIANSPNNCAQWFKMNWWSRMFYDHVNLNMMCVLCKHHIIIASLLY